MVLTAGVVVVLAAALPAHPEPAPRGALMYRTYCALCHGERGQGYVADNANALFHDDFLAAASDDFLTHAVVRGRPGTPMSAWGREHGGPLSDEDVAELVAFVRSQQDTPSVEISGDPVQGDPVAGRAVYDARCAVCHGSGGQGVSAVSLNNPVFLETASDGFLRLAIADGRSGTPMPAFGDLLDDREIDDATALIRSWATPAAPAPAAPADPGEGSPVSHPDGPAPEFSPLREGRYVSAAEVAAALEAGSRLILLDARPPSDWRALRIPGAIPAPFYDVESVKEQLPRDGTWIVCYCGCPHAASGKVMDALRDAGFEHTAVLDEGVFVWEDLGYPTEGG